MGIAVKATNIAECPVFSNIEEKNLETPKPSILFCFTALIRSTECVMLSTAYAHTTTRLRLGLGLIYKGFIP